MKLFTNGTDTVVAASLDAVPAAWESSFGGGFVDEGNDLADWRGIPDDRVIKINIETDEAPFYELVAQTAREWADQNEPGLLCSTEY